MINGLYEAHLMVSDLERSLPFYQKLGLELAWRDQEMAFFWIVKDQSWIGLWQSDAPPENSIAARHIAFGVSFDDMPQAVAWLRERGIEPRDMSGFNVPFVRPYQANASLYFDDPDGNSLELMCSLPAPMDDQPKMSLSDWLASRK